MSQGGTELLNIQIREQLTSLLLPSKDAPDGEIILAAEAAIQGFLADQGSPETRRLFPDQARKESVIPFLKAEIYFTLADLKTSGRVGSQDYGRLAGMVVAGFSKNGKREAFFDTMLADDIKEEKWQEKLSSRYASKRGDLLRRILNIGGMQSDQLWAGDLEAEAKTVALLSLALKEWDSKTKPITDCFRSKNFQVRQDSYQRNVSEFIPQDYRNAVKAETNSVLTAHLWAVNAIGAITRNNPPLAKHLFDLSDKAFELTSPTTNMLETYSLKQHIKGFFRPFGQGIRDYEESPPRQEFFSAIGQLVRTPQPPANT